MPDIIVLAIGAAAGSAVLAAMFVVYVVLMDQRHRTPAEQASNDTVFLFRDDRIIDHTPDAADLFDHRQIQGMTWDELRSQLLPGFPELPEDPPDKTRVWHSHLMDNSTLEAAPTGRSVRLRLTSPPSGPAMLFRSASIKSEFERLKAICDNSPNPTWLSDTEGKVVWYSDAYEALCHEIEHEHLSDCPFALQLAVARSPQMKRLSLNDPAGKPRWYEIASRPMGDGWVHFATSIDSLVNAEMAQRNFVQTLTKTFAHLPIGLAVFDKDRQLVLFNPALVDLTHLQIDFLASKPDLLSFFDTMRENRMMPEPKNYASWRDKLYDVVSAAREDRYAETWNLPSGLTYKITGRPHPDGAVAFLIEDISAEISLTRRFRSELELTQSVLDCFDDAVAVFSRLGVLTFTNAAYRERWNCDPDSSFAEVTIVDTTLQWQDACEPSPIWSELREFVLTLRDRSQWDADLLTREGEHLHCTIEPVAAGATMVRFARISKPRIALAPLAQKVGAKE